MYFLLHQIYCLEKMRENCLLAKLWFANANVPNNAYICLRIPFASEENELKIVLANLWKVSNVKVFNFIKFNKTPSILRAKHFLPHSYVAHVVVTLS